MMWLSHVFTSQRSSYMIFGLMHQRRWACKVDANESLTVDLSTSQDGTLTSMRTQQTGQGSEQAIHDVCNTDPSINHRFRIAVPTAELNIHRGKLIFMNVTDSSGETFRIKNELMVP